MATLRLLPVILLLALLCFNACDDDDSPTGNGGGNGYYWKNNELIKIYTGIVLQSIYIEGNDIYAAGDDGTPWASYWINDKQFQLDTVNNAYANSIEVFNSDIYIAGSYNPAGSYDPCYWKNGDRINLPTAFPATSAYVYDILVKYKNK